jgi:hypothetical protein
VAKQVRLTQPFVLVLMRVNVWAMAWLLLTSSLVFTAKLKKFYLLTLNY